MRRGGSAASTRSACDSRSDRGDGSFLIGGRLWAASVVSMLVLVAAAPSQAGTSLKGWRDGPVSDLLTEDEYRQFGALRTDAARRTFIDGFWRGIEAVQRRAARQLTARRSSSGAGPPMTASGPVFSKARGPSAGGCSWLSANPARIQHESGGARRDREGGLDLRRRVGNGASAADRFLSLHRRRVPLGPVVRLGARPDFGRVRRRARGVSATIAGRTPRVRGGTARSRCSMGSSCPSPAESRWRTGRVEVRPAGRAAGSVDRDDRRLLPTCMRSKTPRTSSGPRTAPF